MAFGQNFISGLGSGLGNAFVSGIGAIGSAGLGLIGSGISSSRAYKHARELMLLSQAWQERMSNTAHQREVSDLRRAGLNPVLSVTGGSGATTPTASASGSAEPNLDLVGSAMAFQQMRNETKLRASQEKLNASQEKVNDSTRYLNSKQGEQVDANIGRLAVQNKLDELMTTNQIENNTAKTLAEVNNINTATGLMKYNAETQRMNAVAGINSARASNRMADYHHSRLPYENRRDTYSSENAYWNAKHVWRDYNITGGDNPNTASSLFLKNRYYRPVTFSASGGTSTSFK